MVAVVVAAAAVVVVVVSKIVVTLRPLSRRPCCCCFVPRSGVQDRMGFFDQVCFALGIFVSFFVCSRARDIFIGTGCRFSFLLGSFSEAPPHSKISNYKCLRVVNADELFFTDDSLVNS